MNNVTFFGTSEFAVPALKKLHEGGYDIAAVVTQPDKPAGRKQELLASPVKIAAQEFDLKILQPEKLTPSLLIRGRLRGGRPDLFIVASYGKIIPKEILNLPKYGTLNIHPSLLPKYRGPSPIQTAILNGDTETGVSIIKLDEQMDHGPIVEKSKFQIPNSKIDFNELHDNLANLGTELLIKILPDYIAGKIKPKPQDDSKATFTKLITKNDARIDWSKSAEEIERMIRAYSDWPIAWTTLDGKRLKIYQSSPLPLPRGEGKSPFLPLDPDGTVGVDGGGKVGVISNAINGKLIITTSSGQLEILSLQLAGSRKMSAKEFLNGFPNLSGKVLR